MYERTEFIGSEKGSYRKIRSHMVEHDQSFSISYCSITAPRSALLATSLPRFRNQSETNDVHLKCRCSLEA